MKKHLPVLIAMLLIAQFLIIAPTLTPEDLVTTVPLMVTFGIGGYTFILMLSTILMALGIVIIFIVSRSKLYRLRAKYL